MARHRADQGWVKTMNESTRNPDEADAMKHAEHADEPRHIINDPGELEAEDVLEDAIPRSPADQPSIEAVQAERDELKEKYLRALADYQNFSRRSVQNIEAAREETRMRMAKALIPVMDHFDRALEFDPDKTTAQDVLEGVRIVRDELMKVLEQFDVHRLEAEVGCEFDPNLHEALMRQPVEGLDPDRIAQQLQPGYLLGDKTLRPAKVAVTE